MWLDRDAGAKLGRERAALADGGHVGRRLRLTESQPAAAEALYLSARSVRVVDGARAAASLPAQAGFVRATARAPAAADTAADAY